MSDRLPPPRYVVRDFVSGQDDPLVFDSWQKCLRTSAVPRFRWNAEVRRWHRQFIGDLVRTSPCKVASHPARPVVIYGWACGGLTEDGRQILYFAFVRSDWRQRGIGEGLMRELFPYFKEREIYYTHRTKSALALEKRWCGVWNPYLSEELI